MAAPKIAPEHAEVNRLVAEIGIPAAGNRLGVAAILYTYRCTITCGHCCFGCCGARPAARMTAEQVVTHLRSLHELRRVIHIAGGECMMYWEELGEALAAAKEAGVSPHFIETNGSFAGSDETVRRRLAELADLGVVGLLLSADPFHQAFVPPENVIRLRRIAREMLGPQNVWCTDEPDERIAKYARIARDERLLRDYVRANPPMLVGAAYRELRKYLDSYPLDEMPHDIGWHHKHTGRDCAVEFEWETMWELHVDPYDNIQTNCGVVLGNAGQTRLADLAARGPEKANEIVRILAAEGPFGLGEFARDRHGFAPPRTACSKCDLCYTTRSFLRPLYSDILGPAEVYDR